LQEVIAHNHIDRRQGEKYHCGGGIAGNKHCVSGAFKHQFSKMESGLIVVNAE